MPSTSQHEEPLAGGGDRAKRGSIAEGDEEDEEKEEELVVFEYNDKGQIIKEIWDENHCKLVYLISRYGRSARTAQDHETWLRQVPLYVLLFEGITQGVLDFDYAPCSMLISHGGRSKRMWFNVSQEGKSAVDDLREKNHLNAVKLITEDFQPVTAFQVSDKGLQFLKVVPATMKKQVDTIIFPPVEALMGRPRELLQVIYKEDTFWLMYDDWEHESKITESEDVSYVSSPFLPECLRSQSIMRKPLSSNKHRSDECATGQSGIADELSEAIVLKEVKALVGEWIPFGSNQIVALNERLGALDRCQGGLFTAIVDTSPTDTQFHVPPGLTQVTILDYDFVRFINFEAEIHYPEENGVIQIENFGMHLSVDGSIVYGVIIEAILDRKSDHVSLDHLSRLLVDVHQDSTKIMDDLLSQYQRSLLDTMFLGDASMRNKYNLILCETMEPLLPADDYMDKDENENELKQVLGDVRAAYDVTNSDCIIVGKDGLLVCGKNILRYEELLVSYLAMLCREIFIRNFFVRLFVLDDLLARIRKLITTYYEDPNYVARIRLLLNQGSRDRILLEEILAYLLESLDEIRLPPPVDEPIGRRLQKMLDVNAMKNDILMRCHDLHKLIIGSANELTTLQQMSDTITTRQLEDVFQSVNANTKYLVDASAAQERASASLEIMQVILSGSFAFDILDRISGGSLNINMPDWFAQTWATYLLAWPMFFWILNMIWLGIVCGGIKKFMAYLAAKATGIMSLKMKIDRAAYMGKLQDYLNTKSIKVFDVTTEDCNRFRKARWDEEDALLWGGAKPQLEILYDDLNSFLLEVSFVIDAKTSTFGEAELLATFIAIFEEHGIWRPADQPDDSFFTQACSAAATDAEGEEEGTGKGKGKVGKKSEEEKGVPVKKGLWEKVVEIASAS